MEHYHFVLRKKYDKTELKDHFIRAIKRVIQRNGKRGLEVEFVERSLDKKVKAYTGVFEKHRVVKAGNIIGHLEVFRNHDFNYLTIDTKESNC